MIAYKSQFCQINLNSKWYYLFLENVQHFNTWLEDFITQIRKVEAEVHLTFFKTSWSTFLTLETSIDSCSCAWDK